MKLSKILKTVVGTEKPKHICITENKLYFEGKLLCKLNKGKKDKLCKVLIMDNCPSYSVSDIPKKWTSVSFWVGADSSIVSLIYYSRKLHKRDINMIIGETLA